MKPPPDAPRRLLMLTSGGWTHAASRVRALQYRPLLEAHGFRVHAIPRVADAPPGGAVGFALAKRWLALRRLDAILRRRWDVVFVQRLFLPPFLLDRLARRGVPLVYDFDDAVFLNTPAQPDNERRAARMIRAARRVVVSTEALAPFCRAHGAEPVVVTTPVDVDRLAPAEPAAGGEGPFTVGWMGSPWTAGYLHEVADALAEASAARPMRLLLVGAGGAELRLPGVEVAREPWSYEREPELLGRMSAGIMPLPDDEWTRGKGGYKLLQYMAAGLPVVASPVGINETIVEHGRTGFIARTRQEWVRALLALADDPALRRRMGAAGRARAVERYSRPVCFARLLEALGAW